MIKQTTPTYKPEGQPITPYARAKAEWDHRIGIARDQAYNWRLVAIGTVLLSLILAGGLLYKSFQNTVVPYIVRINADGSVQTVGPALRLQRDYVPQEAEIKHFLSGWVGLVRSVPADPVMAKQNWNRAYQFLRQPAATKLNEENRKDNPLSRLGKELVQVTVRAVVAVTRDNYQVQWTEEIFGIDGTPKERYKMTGIFTVEIKTPREEKKLLINPLGLYIQIFSWSRDVA